MENDGWDDIPMMDIYVDTLEKEKMMDIYIYIYVFK